MRKILLVAFLFFSLSLNCFAETSIRGLCGELEQTIVAYNKAWVENNKLWVDAINNKKPDQVKFHANNSDAVKKSLDDSVERWSKLDCTSIIYPKNK